jgi:ribosome maturation factor RimP
MAMGPASNSDLPEQIERLIAPALDAMGFEVVRVLLMGGAHTRLQVMVERRDGSAMTLDDCTRLSRTVSALLDVEDPIAGAYTLEVSSPGIDRPLVKERDFERFAGREARIETRQPIAGQRRFRGRLEGFAAGKVRIMTEEGPAELPFADIQKAKLVSEDAVSPATKRYDAKRHKG